MRGATEDTWEASLGVVDTATARALTEDITRLPKPFTVAGFVQTPEGRPVPGAQVRAFDQDLRRRQLLGSPATTGADGRFLVTYTPRQFAAAEISTADITFELSINGLPIVIQALAIVADGATTLVDAPQVIFNADRQTEVVITTEMPAHPGDEFTRLTRALAPVVRDIPIADLIADDITFLAGEFARPQPWITIEKLEFLAESHRLSREAMRRGFEIPAAAFYGLAREGMALELPSLALTPTAELRRRLDLAVADRIISEGHCDHLDRIAEAITRLATNRLLSEPTAVGQAGVGALFGEAGIEADEQVRLLSMFVAHDGSVEEFWEKVRRDGLLGDEAKVDDAQFVMSLGVLLGGKASLIRAMRDSFPEAKNIRELYRGLDISKLSEIVGAHGVPTGIEGESEDDRARKFVAGVMESLGAAFPTDTVTRVLPILPQEHLGGDSTRKAVVRFFERGVNDHNFNLDADRIDEIVAAHGSALLAGVNDDERLTVVNQVKRVQRVFRLSLDSDSFSALMRSGLDSAFDIAQIPPASFHARFSERLGGKERSEMIYDRAATINVSSQVLYARLFDAINGAHVRAAVSEPREIQEAALKQLPNLAKLFGSQELCDCEDCRSIFSPASYFVELLDFLANSTPNASGATPLGVLVGDTSKGIQGRRPDLPFIPLSCENTNTRLPYIDLVNEILEAYVAFGKLDSTLAKDTGKATEEELSANPQYFVATAYQILKDAIFPLSLPYDQALDLLRVYLDHLAASRYDLLRAFDKRDGTLPPFSEQAMEYLGMTPIEFEVITGTQFGGATTTVFTKFEQPWGLEAKDLSPTLAAGAKGLAVRALQRKLNTFGALPALTVNDTLDAATQAALKAFQISQALPATGVPDAATWAQLNAIAPDSAEVFLASVPELLTRSGLQYIDLVELLKTQYVNLGFPRLQFLEDHGITYADIEDLSKTGFITPNANITNALLDPDFGMTTAEFLQWAKDHFNALGELIVLQSPGAKCDLSVTEVLRLNGKPVGDKDWLRINQFIRLWRRLGWSIIDVDRALIALGSVQIDIQAILSLRVIKRLMKLLKLPIAQVLSFWAGIDTQGPDSLYERLFRSRAMQKLDDSFELKPERTELKKTDKLSDHAPALLAALHISEADLAALRQATGLADAPPVFAVMDRASLSLLYRHSVLASALGLSIPEFLGVRKLISFDPFLPPAFGPANTESFVEAALKIRTSKFSMADLNYLYLDEVPALSGPGPSAQAAHQLLDRLRLGLAQIVTEHTLVEDPNGERTRDLLGELFEPDIAQQTVRLLDGTAVYIAPLTGLAPTFAFPANLAPRIQYQPNPGQLSFTGAMTGLERTMLKALSAPLAAPLKAAYEKAIDDLFRQPRTLIGVTLASRGVFLKPADAETHLLHTPTVDEFGRPLWFDADGNVVTMDEDGNVVPPGAPVPVITALAARFRYFLRQLLPFLRNDLSRRLIIGALGGDLQLTTKHMELLLDRASVLHLPTAPAQSVLESFTTLTGDGLLGTYFNAPGLVGATQTRADANINFQWGKGDDVPGSANTPFSVRWTGFLRADKTETFTFSIRTAGGVRLFVDATAVIDTFAAPSPPSAEGSFALVAGEIYPIRIEYTTAKFEGGLEWFWTSPTTPKTLVPAVSLYSTATRASLDNPTAAYRLLHKAALLVNGFETSARELEYLTSHAVDFDNLNLSALPLAPVASNPLLFAQWLRLFDYVTLRNDLPIAAEGGPALIDVFAAASASAAPAVLGAATVQAYRALTGVDLSAAAGTLGLTDADLRNEIGVARVKTILDLSNLTGVDPQQLLMWATKAPDTGPATDIKRIVKAQYDEDTWPSVARPLHDILRAHQRDALVGYLTPRLKLANANQLFEFLLIDVEIGVCMDTSRILQAIAAVQLFIQRCLLGLELDVDRGSIDNKRWQVLRSFRLREAERRVFVHPENWIEPELRHDKSAFFKELEADLLQIDLTPAAVENAFLDYLYKLDEVARLDLVGMYLEDKSEGDGMNDVLHLFGRTAHRPHIYYYRRRINNAEWTPWERLQLDIDATEEGPDSGVHLMPVVWERRLYLFWPQFTEVTDESLDLTRTESDAHKQWRAAHETWEKAHAAWQQAMIQWDKDRKEWERVNNVNGRSEFYPVYPPIEPREPQEPVDDTSIQKPRKFLDVSIAWSQYTPEGRWTPKQTTAMSIRGSNTNRKQYIFQAVPLFDGTLSVSFLSRPITDIHWVHNFNDPAHIHSIVTEDAGLDSGRFLFTGCKGDIETSATRLNPINGRLWVVLPDDSRVDYLRFEKWPPSAKQGLTLDVGDYLSLNVRVVGDNLVKARREPLPLLAATPPISKFDNRQNRFRLLYPHQAPLFVGQVQFCYADDLRAYLVTPYETVADAIFEPNRLMLLPPTTIMRQAAAQVDFLAAAPATNVNLAVASALKTSPWLTRNLFLQIDSGFRLIRRKRFLFENLFHPYACAFIRTLRRGGMDALLSTDNQRLVDLQTVFAPGGPGGLPIPVGFTNNFEQLYKPTSNVGKPTPLEMVDFSLNGSYSSYNWELFFHAVMLVAVNLSRSQRFSDAARWFHYIFDPTSTSSESIPARYWNFLPFKTAEADNIAEMMLLQSTPDSKLTPAQQSKKAEFAAQWKKFKENPFLPHLIARLRPVAYQKNVVVKYIQNLLDWADSLFRQDTRESITEATQLYVLAAELLGPRPERVPRAGRIAAETYDSLKKKQASGKLDPFSNGLVALEQEFPFSAGLPAGAGGAGGSPPAITETLYFCIPFNDRLLGLWDTVSDRLFKIRHCMNIDGITRELPLLAPPIDPGLLVQAVAHGVDLSTVLNELNTPMPLYRFAVLLPKALEFANEVRSFGAALLSTLEKGDAEGLALLRAQHEKNLVNLIREVKTQQLAEARTSKNALDRSLDVVNSRYQYYLNRPDRNAPESNQLDELGSARSLQYDSQSAEQSASMIAMVLPDTSVGVSGQGPHFTATLGRGNIIAYYQAVSREKAFEAGEHSHAANLASILGGWLRRRDEWNQQADQAGKELQQISQQIEAANIRIAIAGRELLNHDQQIHDAERVESFLREKFTDEELYSFTRQELSRLYFQLYQMAFELARKAERAYRFDLGLTTSDFIQYGYWEDARKGLLAGERLSVALRQMERSFQDKNKREYEISRHVSLLLHDPVALMDLKQTGSCEVELPESLFDADYPGHYMRRIKSVSLTIPAVVGPYSNVNCTLTLLSNKTRITSTVGDAYPERLNSDDNRFVSNFVALQSIATSSAQNDAGLFELNFRDERYLPFEGAGAISRWRIDLPKSDNAFDFETISDAILHIRYTAREGGEVVRKAAREALQELAVGDGRVQARLFSLRHEYSSDWYRFFTPVDTNATSQILTLEAPIERFPFRFRGWQINVTEIEVMMPLQDFKDSTGKTIKTLKDYRPKPLTVNLSFLNASGAVTASMSGKLTSARILDGTPYLHWGAPALAPQAVPTRFRIEVQESDVLQLATSLRTNVPPPAGRNRLKPEMIEDIVILMHFTASAI
jgi:hypothetical protein